MSQDEKNKSEIARIREQIAAEADAAQRAMHGFCEGTSKHAFITARMERIGQLHDELSEIDEYATQYLVDTLQDSAAMNNFEVGDEVEVIEDYRPMVNGQRGIITEINGDRARVKFDHIGRAHEADVHLANLRKIKEVRDHGKE